jgi:hypothetical protein
MMGSGRGSAIEASEGEDILILVRMDRVSEKNSAVAKRHRGLAPPPVSSDYRHAWEGKMPKISRRVFAATVALLAASSAGAASAAEIKVLCMARRFLESRSELLQHRAHRAGAWIADTQLIRHRFS